MINVLVLHPNEEGRTIFAAQFRKAFPDLNLQTVAKADDLDAHIATADVLMGFRLGPRANDIIAKAERLKWIQALGTGVDSMIDLPALKPDVLITRVHGIHGPAMSEAAVMAMLALSRNLPFLIHNQDKHVWQGFRPRVLEGKTAGILGVGAIAEELAPRLKPFDMTVVGISTGVREVPSFDRIYPREQLVKVVGELDYFILLTPYSAETRHIINRDVLAAMKPTAYLVNLARGGIVDEAALLDALQKKQIAGAALDVFSTQPLPADSPFWSLDNVIITAQSGGTNENYEKKAMPIVEHNMRRFLANDLGGMRHVMRKPAGK